MFIFTTEKNSKQIINYNASEQIELFIFNKHEMWLIKPPCFLWINQRIYFDEGKETTIWWIANIVQSHFYLTIKKIIAFIIPALIFLSFFSSTQKYFLNFHN